MKIPAGDLDLLAIGEAVVDMISLEETDSMQDAYTFRKYQGGSPANLAVYMAKLGKRTALISKTGTGAFGLFLKDSLEQAGVETQTLVMDPHVHTTVIFISRTPRTADSVALREGDYHLTPDEVDEATIARAKIIYSSTFALSREPARAAVEKAFRLAHQYGKLISLDPNYNPPIWPDQQEARAVLRKLFRYVTFTKPSLDDARRLFGPGQTEETYIDYYHEMGPEIVVLTMGQAGILLSHQGKKIHIPSHPVKVVDATGAGDAFWAGFLAALLDGNPPERCIHFAREVAKRALALVGPFPDPIDRQEIYRLLDAQEKTNAASEK